MGIPLWLLLKPIPSSDEGARGRLKPEDLETLQSAADILAVPLWKILQYYWDQRVHPERTSQAIQIPGNTTTSSTENKDAAPSGNSKGESSYIRYLFLF